MVDVCRNTWQTLEPMHVLNAIAAGHRQLTALLF